MNNYKISILIFLLICFFSCSEKELKSIHFKFFSPDEIGIDFVHNNTHNIKYRYPEIMGSGVAVLDYDLDGDLDLYFVQSGTNKSDQLYKSLVKETDRLYFVNVTNDLNINQINFGIGAAVGDYNNDSFPDIFISNWQSNVLLKNVNGESFEDVSDQVNIEKNKELTVMSTFVDLNNNGWQDLVVINNINYNESIEPQCLMMQGVDYCGPSSYSYLKNNIYQNVNGVYSLIPDTYTGFQLELPSLVLSSFDVTNDGYPDIYIGNDEKTNTLWINQGLFKFSEEGLISGVSINSMAKPEASMGIAIGDINSDGLLDLYLTHMWQETNTLYMQQSQRQFVDLTNQYALARPSYEYTGFGTAFLDFENDGDLDIVVANGSIMRNIDGNYNETNSFYENNGNQFITLDNNKILSKNPIFSSRGLIRADLDNDGDSDIIITNNNGSPEIYINESQHENNWIGYSAYNESGRLLENIESMVEYNNKTIRNIQSRSGSYASSSDPRVLIGLGQNSQPVTVTIRWNPFEFEKFDGLHPNKYYKLIKGQGISVSAWPQNASHKDAIVSPKRMSDVIEELLNSQASKVSKDHIKELYSENNRSSLTLCKSLQSYEFIKQASYCYDDYLSGETKVDAEVYYLAAVNALNTYNYKQANRYFDMAMTQKPQNWLFCIRKSQAYFKDNQFDLARTQLSACKKIKEDANNDKLSGDIYLAKKQYKKAFQAYRDVLKKEPSANHVYYQMGESLKYFQSEKVVNLALEKAGKRKLKIRDDVISKLIEYNRDPEYHYEKALLANQNQDIDSAINAMARAYHLAPNNENIIRNYALFLNQIKRYNDALSLFINNNGNLNNPKSYLIYGTLLTRLNQINQAQVIYQQGLKTDANNIALLTNLTNNYLRNNQLNKAEKEYNKILKLDPNNANAQNGLKKIHELSIK